jgi:hypothetical protein
MPSHFSTIGFDLRTGDQLLTLANQVTPASRILRCAKGRYLCWNGGRGEELWLQVGGDGALMGMNPHFSGKASLRIGLQSRVHRDTDTALNGAFHGWADPQDASSDSGAYPLVFDSPDAALHDKLHLPAIVPVQIAAFAHEITLFPSLADYESSQQGGELHFASKSFIPSGLFSPDGKSTDPPDAFAIFTGHVLESARRTNALTGNPFHWALVDTYGGQYDVVIDPQLSPDLPQPGGIVSGSFWLSGRLLAYPN